MEALFYAIHLAVENFKVTHERDFIMDKIFTGSSSENDETRKFAFQTLSDIPLLYYESIEFYFAKICELTANAARKDEESVGSQAIEFWTTLAEEELKYKQKNT